MQALLGSLLTAGYAAAMARQIGSSPDAAKVTDASEATLQKSFTSAQALAEQYPQYASQITAAARESFLTGANWAYLAAIIAGLGAIVLVRLAYPGKEREIEMLNQYANEDAASTKSAT